jgi:hypothetical protein
MSSGVTHQRLLNLQVGTLGVGDEPLVTGFGQNASIAAMIAATSSTVAPAETSIFTSRGAR